MIIIHIGLKKAGSTSLQHFLRSNETALRPMGIDYARIGRADRFDHNNLANEILRRPRFRPEQGSMAQLADYWRGRDRSTLVMSGEFFEDFGAPEVSAVRDILHKADDDFRIVVFLRDLIEQMYSSYAQKIKFGKNVFDFDKFFDRRLAEDRVDYYQTVARWGEVFGWENLRVRVLDPDHLARGDLIAEFLAIAGLDPDSDAIEALPRPARVNVAPGWRVLEAIRALYGGKSALPHGHALANFAEHNDFKRKMLGLRAMELGDRVGWNRDRGLYLTQDQAERCSALYDASTDMINAHLAAPLTRPRTLEARGFTARAFLPDATHIHPAELIEFYDRLGAMPLKKTPAEKHQGPLAA